MRIFAQEEKARLHSSRVLTTLSSVGSKLKHGAEFLGAVKTAYDAGRVAHGMIQPLAAAALAVA